MWKIGNIIIIPMVFFLMGFFYWLGFENGIGNIEARYGETGFPVNCRALIADNIAGYELNLYTIEEAMGSINRNCGINGIIWNER